MSRESFVGTYEVVNTFGTDFGLRTAVEIADLNGQLQFRLSLQSGIALSYEATYDEKNDALRVEMPETSATMFVSELIDGAAQYQAIYGVIVLPPRPNETRYRLANWGAKKVEPFTPSSSTTDPARAAFFEGAFRAKSSAGAQFGSGSLIEIGVDEPGVGRRLSIKNALGQLVEPVPRLEYDVSTASLRGKTIYEGQPVGIQISLALFADELRDFKVFYGISTVADPEQAATWAGDDDGNP